ncbi:MAG: OmpA family protein [Bacteroidetes bacterium]|nr:OmpA family protein [Bacteroidota bacterium]
MKKHFTRLLLPAAYCLLLTGFFACVPQSKFLDEKTKRENCEKDLANCKSSSQKMETELSELKNKMAEEEKQLAGLQKDTSITGTNYRNLVSKYDKLNDLNEKLLDKYNRLLSGSNSESQKLSGQLSSTQEQLQRKEDDLKQLQTQLDQKKKDLDALTDQLKQREQRVKELEDILKQKDEAVNALKKKISDALTGFEGKGLTITQKNGKVYVSMEESLLFATGKWAVEPKGQEVLKKLAKVLETNSDINVMVEGHTDDVPMKGMGDVKDNWDLSAVRATSVVKIITSNSSVDPKRLTAAGRGEYFPLDDSKTKEARAKNRRTEIILTPKLDELLKVLETN